jgi:hypothetical protein
MGKCNTQFLHAQRLHQLTLAAEVGKKGTYEIVSARFTAARISV